MSKRLLINTILFILVIAVAAFLFWQRWKQVQATPQKQVEAPLTTPVIPSPQPSKGEIFATRPFTERSFIYATKEGVQVSVFERNFSDGKQIMLFSYDEAVDAKKSGNLWEGLPPSVAFSESKNSLAYIDEEGLKVYDLATKTTRIYVRKIKEAIQDTMPQAPLWSPDMPGTFGIARPAWSADGRYISFSQMWYEGGGAALIDTETEKYSALGAGAGYQTMSWSKEGHSLLKPGGGVYEGSGLLVFSSEEKGVKDISHSFVKEEYPHFFEASFSRDAKRIVFTLVEPGANENETTLLGIVNSDGTGFRSLGEKDAYMPFFSSDGASVFYLKPKDDGYVLIRYDLATKKREAVMPLPATFNAWSHLPWTEDALLPLIGVAQSSSLIQGGDATQLMLLDIAKKQMVYTSPLENLFVNFMGLKR